VFYIADILRRPFLKSRPYYRRLDEWRFRRRGRDRGEFKMVILMGA
jgi:hypothetical protein